MSADEQVMNMVNGAGEIKAGEPKDEQSKVREFWKMARAVLGWILAGAVLVLLMSCGQIAVWLAATCTCACVVAAAINIDRFVWGGRNG